MRLTAAQITLARHALGLPNRTQMSFRNRSCAGSGHKDHPKWDAMVRAGAATVMRNAGGLGGQDTFSMTLAGAKVALNAGETLCPEDFPEATP